MTAKAKQEKKMTLRYTDDEIQLIGLPTHPELTMVISVGEKGEDSFFIDVREQTEDEGLGDSFVYAPNHLYFDGVEAMSKKADRVMEITISKPGKRIVYSFYLDSDNHLNFGSVTITEYDLLSRAVWEILL
jgi:hypothetical protein